MVILYLFLLRGRRNVFGSFYKLNENKLCDENIALLLRFWIPQDFILQGDPSTKLQVSVTCLLRSSFHQVAKPVELLRKVVTKLCDEVDGSPCIFTIFCTQDDDQLSIDWLFSVLHFEVVAASGSYVVSFFVC